MNQNEMFLLKMGEVVLKGLNRRAFEDKLMNNVRRRMRRIGSFQVYMKQSTIYVEPQGDCDLEETYKACRQIFGIAAVARAVPCEKTIEAIKVFQAHHGLEQDGVAGSATMNKIRSLIDPSYAPSSSSASGGVTTYDVYVALEGDVDSRVLGGMNVSGEILVSSVSNALLLPSEAVFQDGGAWDAQLQNGEYRQVELGVTTDRQVQILSGLSEGDVVIY